MTHFHLKIKNKMDPRDGAYEEGKADLARRAEAAKAEILKTGAAPTAAERRRAAEIRATAAAKELEQDQQAQQQEQ